MGFETIFVAVCVTIALHVVVTAGVKAFLLARGADAPRGENCGHVEAGGLWGRVWFDDYEPKAGHGHFSGHGYKHVVGSCPGCVDHALIRDLVNNGVADDVFVDMEADGLVVVVGGEKYFVPAYELKRYLAESMESNSGGFARYARVFDAVLSGPSDGGNN